MSMMRPPEDSVAFVILGSTPSTPLKKKLFLTNYEDDLITAVVAFLLTGMFLAYLCLCCHVWGLHMRLFQLIKSLRSGNTNQRNGERGQEGRPSVSVPMAGTSLEDYTTPPPRYSLVADSLPTYSCAIIRMLGLLRGPVELRILVYVDPSTGNSSTFSEVTPEDSRADPNLRQNVFATMSCEHDPSPTTSNEVFSTAACCSTAVTANSIGTTCVENNPHFSDTSGSLYSVQSETSSTEGATDHSSCCELSVLSTTTQSSNENTSIPLPSASKNDGSIVSLPAITTSVVSPTENNKYTSVNTIPESHVDENNNGRCRLDLSHAISCAHSANSASPVSSSSTHLESISTHIPNINSFNNLCDKRACQESTQHNVSREAVNGTRMLAETSDRLLTHESSDHETSIENRSPSNSIRLLMKGLGGLEQVVYALKSTSNCYVAHWPLPSKDLLDSDYLEVAVHGQAVEDIFLEFLNGEGERVGMTQLLPSPGSSTVSSRYASNADAPQFSPSLDPSPAPPSPALPPPYHP